MNDTTIHQHRCERVRQVRELTGLRRRSFALKHGIPNSSLQNWEDLKANGLTERGARRFVKALESEGIFCSIEWLLYGIGAGPQQGNAQTSLNQNADHPQLISHTAQQANIEKEIALFHQHNVDQTIDYTVSDDAMSPTFVPGDRVAGRVHSHDQLHRLDGLDCIVQTASGEQLLRRLKSAGQNRFHLHCINPNAKAPTEVTVVTSAAPVVLVRRLFPCEIA